jgi:hypothetical protein
MTWLEKLMSLNNNKLNGSVDASTNKITSISDKITSFEPDSAITRRLNKYNTNLEKKDIKGHYNDSRTYKIISKFTDYNGFHKAGVYDDEGWYQYSEDKKRLLDLNEYTDYVLISFKIKRRLLSTLNYFKPDIFKEWIDKGANSPGGFEDTIYYMLSVDIDLTDNYTVDDEKAKEALETAAKWIYQKLDVMSNGKLMAVFSGNGVYIHLHPGLAHLPDTYGARERADIYDTLTKAFNLHLQKLELEMFEDNPWIHGLVKVDAINNRKRLFKAPLSLHKKLPYVVYPINPDNFIIPFKTLPLSDKDFNESERLITDFMDQEISKNHIQGMKVLKEYKEEIKTNKQDYDKLNLKLPETAISIDIIKTEPVTKAIFELEPWSKGNTRRVAYMTSILHLAGWKDVDIKTFILNLAGDWDIGSLDHVINSWLNMYPPNVETIYNIGSNYPFMNFGDCKEHLPKKPSYNNTIREIYRLAKIEDQVESDNFEMIEDEIPDIKLEYPTEHLKGFQDLAAATTLFGDEYIPIFKALHYQLMSYKIRESDIKVGQARVDGRIACLYPIPAGHGKGEIKRIIKKFVKSFGDQYGEPTSLHAEQLVGKTIISRFKKNSKINKKDKQDKKDNNDENNGYESREGYLADDWVVIDEAYNLLTSGELHYSEARKYIRSALDRFPENKIHKRTVDIGAVAPLEYSPKCNLTEFVQPRTFENDLLVEEGDLRRFIVPYVPMRGLDKREALENNILNETDNEAAFSDFKTTVETLTAEKEYKITQAAKLKLIELSLEIIDYGLEFNEKVRNFTDIIYYTLPNHLIKFSAVQAFQHGRDTIEVSDVIMAFIDLFEIMHHNYLFVHKKIPGLLDYGEGWQGAGGKDQEALLWLHEQGATSLEESVVQIKEYREKIKTLFNVQKRRAQEIIKRHKELGWVDTKVLPGDSRVWLNFKPEFHQGAAGAVVHRGEKINIDNKKGHKYYYYIQI